MTKDTSAMENLRKYMPFRPINNNYPTPGFRPINSTPQVATMKPVDLQPKVEEKKPLFTQNKWYGKVANFLTKAEQGLGENVGQALANMTGTGKMIEETNKKNLDTGNQLVALANKEKDQTKKQKLLDLAKKSFEAAGTTYQEVLPAIKKTNKQMVGETLGTALDVATAGTYTKAKAATTALPTTVKTLKDVATVGVGALKGAKQGLKVGVPLGAAYGVTGALQEDKGLKDTALSAATGAVTGGAISGALGGALGAVGAKVTSKIAQKAEQKSLLATKTPSADIATKTLKNGKVVVDKVAKEAVRQGLPEADVALIKLASDVDKSKMAKMLDIRLSQLKNKRVVERATDVVGDSFVNNIAKPIEKLNKEAGKKLDEVAKNLKGQAIDLSEPVNTFKEVLDNIGVKIDNKGQLNFLGSSFEGLQSQQTLISNIFNRVNRVLRNGDALEAHRLKSFIDETVNYGKEAEGLSGKAQNLLKGLRHDIDTILDTNFPEYNQVNTQFADTVNQLNDMGAAIGRTFKLGDSFADARSGLAMRRILSNTVSRSEILKLLQGMQETLKKYGIEVSDDVITQANFADVLEKMLGTEAPTSLLGNITKGLESFGSSSGFDGVQQIGSAGSEFMRGNVIKGTIKAGGQVINVLRNVSQEKKIEILKSLLKIKGLPKAK